MVPYVSICIYMFLCGLVVSLYFFLLPIGFERTARGQQVSPVPDYAALLTLDVLACTCAQIFLNPDVHIS